MLASSSDVDGGRTGGANGNYGGSGSGSEVDGIDGAAVYEY